MVDQFQAYLLFGLTALFVYLVVRVVRDDRESAKRGRKKVVVPYWQQPRQ